MNSRYLTNVALAVVGGFLIVASQVWSVPVFMWLMLGGGVAAIALSGAIAIADRGATQRMLDGLIGVIAAWTIVASLVFAGSLVTWLGLASGAALVILGLAGLTLHELTTERVVHSFEVHPAAERAAVEHPVDDREFAGVN